MAYFPLFIDLERKKCLVVGGGRVAARKAAQLLAFGAELLVVAKEASPAMQKLAAGTRQDTAKQDTGWKKCAGAERHVEIGSIRLLLRPAVVEDADGMDLVVCASNDHDLHQEIAVFCRERRIWVDVADDRAASSFLFPGLVRQGDVVLGITTGGESPAATRYLRRQIQETVPAFFGCLVKRLGTLRELVKERVEDPREREKLFTQLLALGMEREGRLPDELVMEKLDAWEKQEDPG